MSAAPRTVLDGFLATTRRRGDAVAIRDLTGPTWTWTEHAERVARVAAGLRHLGVGPADRVVLVLRNRVEFHVVDLAVQALRATAISVYNSSSPDQLAQLIGHCHARVVVTESGDFAERVLAAAATLPAVDAVVVVGDLPAEPAIQVVGFDDLLTAEPVDLHACEAELDPTDLVTVIYTSGTTGPPKGVMLDHRNVLAATAGTSHYLGRDTDDDEVLVSYLPMAHIAERMVSHYLHVLRGSEVVPCPDMATLAPTLVQVRPTLLFGPPRVFEKLAAGVKAAVAARGEEAVERFAGALEVGRKVQRLTAAGKQPEGDLAQTWAFVDEVALAPLRAAIGLDRCTVAFSGAAPLAVEVIDFLRDIGLPMSEVYGMSENTGGMTWEPHLVRPGRVGTAYPGVEVVTAEDGEVLCRGPIVFPGYLDDPERTAEALDTDGWLHTGDIGEIDADGYLRIVDRKKELIITAGGKNVSPANVEAVLKGVPLVGQAAAFGDSEPYLVALLTLDPDAVRARFGDRPLADVAADSAVVAEVAAGVAEASERLSRVERPRRIVVLGEEWLPDSDVLTPTTKLKRRGIAARYGAEFEAMYAGGGTEIPTEVTPRSPR